MRKFVLEIESALKPPRYGCSSASSASSAANPVGSIKKTAEGAEDAEDYVVGYPLIHVHRRYKLPHKCGPTNFSE